MATDIITEDDEFMQKCLGVIAKFLNTDIESLGDPLHNQDDLISIAEQIPCLNLKTIDHSNGMVEIYTEERGYKESIITASPFSYAAILGWGIYLDRVVH